MIGDTGKTYLCMNPAGSEYVENSKDVIIIKRCRYTLFLADGMLHKTNPYLVDVIKPGHKFYRLMHDWNYFNNTGIAHECCELKDINHIVNLKDDEIKMIRNVMDNCTVTVYDW